MASQPSATDVSALPPRAAIALLALQLRTAEREAEEAEARERGWDLDTALEQLRDRMTALITARRAVLDAALADERAAADEAIEAARARRAVLDAALAVPPPPPFPPPTCDVDDVNGNDEIVISDNAIEAPTIEPPIGPSPEIASRAVWGPPTTELVAPLTADDVRAIVASEIERLGASTPNGMPVNGVIDPEAFARAFASAFGAAFGAMLDERTVAYQTAPPVAQWPRFAPAPAPARKSFWTNIWHADVMLSMLAAVIVLVVLIAWST